MKISPFSIQEISKFITGDSGGWPYRTGYELVEFFNKFGFREFYDQKLAISRASFAKNKLTELNGKPKLKDVITEMLDPRLWINSTSTVEEYVIQINKILDYDGYQVIKDEKFYKVRESAVGSIELEYHFAESDELSEVLIEEQIKKCREKIESADYSGAITNARSLVEAVCVKIEADLDPNALGNKGDLINLFNRVRVLLNLDPSRKDISNSLKQVLSGFSSIIQGLAAMRNSMSDAHAMPYKPNRHHAKLAVNSAKTLAGFLFDSMNYQIERGSLKKKS